MKPIKSYSELYVLLPRSRWFYNRGDLSSLPHHMAFFPAFIWEQPEITRVTTVVVSLSPRATRVARQPWSPNTIYITAVNSHSVLLLFWPLWGNHLTGYDSEPILHPEEKTKPLDRRVKEKLPVKGTATIQLFSSPAGWKSNFWLRTNLQFINCSTRDLIR